MACHKKHVGLLIDKKDLVICKELTYQIQAYSKACPQGILTIEVALKAKVVKSLFEIEINP